MSDKFEVLYVGTSSDGRTNKWRLTCKICRKIHEPITTLLAYQSVECPNCGEKENINYNDL